MTGAIQRLEEVTNRIAAAERASQRRPGSVRLVAVSKTFGPDEVRPVIEAGQRVFGENRVQEALGKWPGLKDDHGSVELRLIGPLQSNKTKEAVALFDVIESVDRDRIAAALSREIRRQDRRPELYVQVNTGREPQKAGIDPQDTVSFVMRCRDTHGLQIAGLMCIPPLAENPGPHFALLAKLAEQAATPLLSMGMSADFELAIEFGATSVRVGSAIFGERA